MKETEDLRGRSWVQDGDIAQQFSVNKSLNGHRDEIVVLDRLRYLRCLILHTHTTVRILSFYELIFY